MKLSELKTNPSNPRLIKDDKFHCLTCGIEFTSDKACKTRAPKYCSKDCYSKSLLKLKICPVCGKQYPSDPNTKYCSVECYHKGRPSRGGHPLPIEWRNALSIGRRRSEKCKGKNLYNWKGGVVRARERNIESYHKRRALGELDGTYLKILFHLQKGKCYYCGGDISRSKAVEHLNPVSKGGDNNWINLVYACKSCNSKKHDKTLAEFAIQNIRPDWLNNMVQFHAHEIREKYAS